MTTPTPTRPQPAETYRLMQAATEPTVLPYQRLAWATGAAALVMAGGAPFGHQALSLSIVLGLVLVMVFLALLLWPPISFERSVQRQDALTNIASQADAQALQDTETQLTLAAALDARRVPAGYLPPVGLPVLAVLGWITLPDSATAALTLLYGAVSVVDQMRHTHQFQRTLIGIAVQGGLRQQEGHDGQRAPLA
ncbi:hypothetical protein [Deinococcus soli (ex Cha et al. 2016)]|uniref:hypothetical protein n=1 Tax=Deinococcus soli (ex Cha et al. 2016) TaxID=1309411 RepID=UPI00166C8963|nr:hypothetical protein [Deinococcus soli (ex Cha et al. 2016)]GGB79377.1 hypothetical protein GCM10008019_39500 [Deinococcus soli (ex Cha et al. 2016)]